MDGDGGPEDEDGDERGPVKLVPFAVSEACCTAADPSAVAGRPGADIKGMIGVVLAVAWRPGWLDSVAAAAGKEEYVPYDPGDPFCGLADVDGERFWESGE